MAYGAIWTTEVFAKSSDPTGQQVPLLTYDCVSDTDGGILVQLSIGENRTENI